MRSLLALLIVLLGDALARADDAEVTTDISYLRPACQKMLKMQRAIRDESRQLAKRIADRKDQMPACADEQQAQALAEREAKVVGELRKILDRLEADGTVVAFAEVFQQVKDDVTAVQRRLGKIDLSQASLALQAELIETLKEMLEDLEEPQMS